MLTPETSGKILIESLSFLESAQRLATWVLGKMSGLEPEKDALVLLELTQHFIQSRRGMFRNDRDFETEAQGILDALVNTGIDS